MFTYQEMGFGVMRLYSIKVYWGSSYGDSSVKEIRGGGKWCVLSTGKAGVSGPREG